MSNDYIEKCAEDMLEAENAEPGCPLLPLTSYHTFIFIAVICWERSVCETNYSTKACSS